jgi:flagellar hook-associated protein 3 FlgL
MATRITTFSLSNNLISDTLRVQQNYAKTNLQISSGYKSDNYMDVAPDTQIIVDLKSNISRYDIQEQNAQRVRARTESMFAAMGSLNDFANQFILKLTQAMSGSYPNAADTLASAQSIQTNVVAALNTKVAGRYLFAGSMIETQPVNLSDPTYNNAQTTPSVVDTNYYQGDAVRLSAQVADNHTITYGVTADSAAFEQILRALNLVINNPSDIATLQEAHTLTQQAIDGMATIQADLSQKSAAIETQILQSENDKNYLDELLTGLTKTDIAEATMRLTDYQTQLEASFSVISRLKNLSLHDYL